MNNELPPGTTTSKRKKTLDPLVTLLYHESSLSNIKSKPTSVTGCSVAVTSVCFFNHCGSDAGTYNNEIVSNSEADSDDTDDENEFPIQLQCQKILQSDMRLDGANTTTNAHDESTRMELSGRLLGACYSNGTCLLWDLGQRKIKEYIATSDGVSRGPGLSLRRLDDNDTRFFYQTRDEAGTISLHDVNATSAAATAATNTSTDVSTSVLPVVRSLQQVETRSQSFCNAAPCLGNGNLVVTPCQSHSYVIVRDWRIPSTQHPVAYFHGASGKSVCSDGSFDESMNPRSQRCGMVTSLAMAESNNGGTTAIACGMESGLVVFHDLAMIRKKNPLSCDDATEPCNLSLSTEPILSLDMVSSWKSNIRHQPSISSFVTIAGMAGNEEDMIQLPVSDRGRVALVKIIQGINNDKTFRAQLRRRISTFVDVPSSRNDDDYLANGLPLNGKPGVGQCRFRSDGRIFAVGGWDKRVRIYGRSAKNSTSAPLAILRGHLESVNAIDWSFDSVNSGLLATGSSDSRVHVWRCFPSKVGVL
jgi:WD domain, G-beta repeat